MELKKKFVTLLLKNGADKTLLTNQKGSLLDLCFQGKNYELLDFFIESSSFNRDKNLLFTFSEMIYSPKIKKIFFKIGENDKPTAETLKILDKEGRTPFLRFIDEFMIAQVEMESTINEYITYLIKKKKYYGDYNFEFESLKLSYDIYSQKYNTLPEITNYYL